jgi:hypothetical protein
MRSYRLLAGCAGALALLLSTFGAVAAPAAPNLAQEVASMNGTIVTPVRFGGGGGGFHAGGFGGYGGGFHGGGFHAGGFHSGFHGGGFRGIYHLGGFHGGRHFHGGHHHFGRRFYGGYLPYYGGYYGDDCWWSPRRHHWVCPGY